MSKIIQAETGGKKEDVSSKGTWTLNLLRSEEDKNYYDLTCYKAFSCIVFEEYQKNCLAILLKNYYFNNQEQEYEDFVITPLELNNQTWYQFFSHYNFAGFLLPKTWLEELIEFSKTWN